MYYQFTTMENVVDVDDGCIRFELVDFTRKLLMAGGVVFLDRGSANQFFVAIFIALVFLVIDTFVRPYQDFRCNALKVLTSMSMLITLLCGLVSKLDAKEEVVSDETLGWTLIVSSYKPSHLWPRQSWHAYMLMCVAQSDFKFYHRAAGPESRAHPPAAQPPPRRP